MENTLFNQHRMDKYAKDKSFNIKPSQHDLIKKHIEKLGRGELKAETSNYLYFFDVFIRDILGYDRDENVLFDETVDKGAKRSEFVLKNDDKKFMIVELKGQSVDLDTHQKGHNNQTPIEQAREYSLKTKSANWIMVSNYDEFRLYHWDKKDDYISFKAEELLDKDKFGYFMLSFSKISHLKENYTDKLLKESLVVEKDIEADFYKLFHETRLMLIKELEDINGFDTPKAVHYAQAILNRYMFICFAEDINNLLPSEISTETIYVPIRENNISQRTIWNRLNELFGFINNGNKYKGVNRYNGGLFKEDFSFITIRDIVEDPNYFKDQRQKWDLKEYSLKINELMGPYGKKINPIYWNLLTISSINFESDLDVNILGHIFENSIGDLEDLKEGSKGRRKKDGIFYTPAYITEYICKNTIIPYLSKSGKSTEVKDLIDEYWGSDIHELDEKVKKIRIVDPACGSGAFLNKAADILVEIHEEIHKTLYKDDKTLAKFFDNVGERRKILKNNIYGVDLNEESVEITKLSMFLKVAQKDSALPDLDKNIKCGNSIVDDPEYAGEKAFNWEERFSEIFEEGKFDVVIGNPPYVRQERIKEIKPYLKDHYGTYTGVADLYVYFFEKGLNILKECGILSFICSNKFIKANYGKNLRKFILDNSNFEKYVDHTYDDIFDDATTYPSVFVFKKGHVEGNKILVNNEFEMEQSRLDENVWSFVRPEILDLRDKICATGIELKNFEELKINYGIKTGFNEAFIIDDKKKNELIKEDPKSIEIIKPLLRGKDIKRYKIDFKELYLIWTYIGVPIDNYPAIKNHLEQYMNKLQKRSDKGNYWWELRHCNYYPEFEKDKLIYPNLASRLFTVFDNDNFFTNQKCFIITSSSIDLKFLGALLSSKALNFVFKFLGTPLQGSYYDLNKKYVEGLPIYSATPEEQQPLIDLADIMLQLNFDLQTEISNFHNWLQRTFNIEKLSQKLEKYYERDFEEFLKEVKKKKVDIKPRKTQELLENEFNESIAVIKPLLQQIKETDREIDERVYDMYGLTDEEKKIIENILK